MADIKDTDYNKKGNQIITDIGNLRRSNKINIIAEQTLLINELLYLERFLEPSMFNLMLNSLGKTLAATERIHKVGDYLDDEELLLLAISQTLEMIDKTKLKIEESTIDAEKVYLNAELNCYINDIKKSTLGEQIYNNTYGEKVR